MGVWPMMMMTSWESRDMDQRTAGCHVRVTRIELCSHYFLFNKNDGPLCLL